LSAKNFPFLYFHKNIICSSVGLLRVSQVFLFPVKLFISGLQQVAVM